MSRIAVPFADSFEYDESSIPGRLAESHHEVLLIDVKLGAEVEGKRHRVRVEIDAAAARLDSDDFDVLLMPGGHSPDHLRSDPAVVSFVQGFGESKRSQGPRECRRNLERSGGRRGREPDHVEKARRSPGILERGPARK